MLAKKPEIKRREIKIQLHAKTQFLAEPHRYKCLYGGRSGLKSWAIARQLVINAASGSKRILCAREVMDTIKESVHLLMKDQIAMLGLERMFEIQDAGIYGRHKQNIDTRIVYTGLLKLRTDSTALKAFESYDILWLEEAQTASAESIRTVIPTFRKPGSEIWISYNPMLESDPIVDFTLKNPPDGMIAVETSYLDAAEVGWLSDESRNYIEHLKKTNEQQFNEDYGGQFRKTVPGAVFGEELSQMVKAGRETRVPHDPSKPVETYWDIGDRYTAVWMIQKYPFEYHIIDYKEFELSSIPAIFTDLHRKPYNFILHTMTADAKSNQLATGKTIEQQAQELAGLNKIRVLGITTLKAQISSAKTIFPHCYFDAVNCKDGLHALRHYRFPEPGRTGVEQDKPLHDWASHGGSAFQTFAVGVKEQQFEPQPEPVSIIPNYISAWS